MRSVNRIVYLGVLIVVATAAIWVGAELTRRIVWLLPYSGGLGVALICGGFIYDVWKKRQGNR